MLGVMCLCSSKTNYNDQCIHVFMAGFTCNER